MRFEDTSKNINIYNQGWNDCKAEMKADLEKAQLNEAYAIHDQMCAQAELADIHNSHKFIMDEKCSSQEKHCGCVPLLRAELTALKAANELQLQALIENQKDTIRAKRELAELELEADIYKKDFVETYEELRTLKGAINWYFKNLQVSITDEVLSLAFHSFKNKQAEADLRRDDEA
uniref:Putative transcriptional regulator n=1 Tax=viral metagenome TaxID=1070528 RepID=A0A6M3LTK3_9ZZZZ